MADRDPAKGNPLTEELIPPAMRVPTKPEDYNRALKRVSKTMLLEEIASRINMPLDELKRRLK